MWENNKYAKSSAEISLCALGWKIADIRNGTMFA